MTITDAPPPFKILVTGANGMLGQAVVTALIGAQYDVRAVTRSDFDICERSHYALLDQYQPDVIVNCAAYTQVDRAEIDFDDADLANHIGPSILAQWCALNRRRLIHFSTDYVFPGTGTHAWTEDDPTAPINRYGESKYLGEVAIQSSGCSHLILRIQWLYGNGGYNFVDTMVNLLRTKSEVSVVNDQIGSLTWTHDVASQVIQLLDRDLPYGIYHLAASGYGSWFDVAETIKQHIGASTPILPVSSDAFPRPAQRPLNSRLNTEKLKSSGIIPIENWKKRLSVYLDLIDGIK